MYFLKPQNRFMCKLFQQHWAELTLCGNVYLNVGWTFFWQEHQASYLASPSAQARGEEGGVKSVADQIAAGKLSQIFLLEHFWVMMQKKFYLSLVHFSAFFPSTVLYLATDHFTWSLSFNSSVLNRTLLITRDLRGATAQIWQRP